MFCEVLRCWHFPLGIVVYSTPATYRHELYASRQGGSNIVQDRKSIRSRRRVALHFSGPMTHGESLNEVRDLPPERLVHPVKTEPLYLPLRSPCRYRSPVIFSSVHGHWKFVRLSLPSMALAPGRLRKIPSPRHWVILRGEPSHDVRPEFLR